MPPPLRRLPGPLILVIRTLNIRNGRSFGLVQEVQVVKLGGFNLMVITKIKISTMVFFWNCLGYNIFCSTARPASAGGAQGGVDLVSQ